MKQVFLLLCMMFFITSAFANCDLEPKFSYSTKGKTLILKNQSKGDYTSVEWNMGDGTLSKEENPRHSYSEQGMYTFSITISNEEGCTETFEGKVYIFDLQGGKDENDAKEEVPAAKPAEDEQQIAELERDITAKTDIQYLTSLNNYPNPFNNTTTIFFNLSKDTHVTVQLYNLTGRLVDVLVDDFLSSGRQELVFERADLPSGHYIVTAVVNEDRYSRKVTIQ